MSEVNPPIRKTVCSKNLEKGRLQAQIPRRLGSASLLSSYEVRSFVLRGHLTRPCSP